MSNLLITGVSGFLGSHIAHHFADRGNSVIGIDTVPPDDVLLTTLSAYFQMQLPNKQLSDILKYFDVEACIHCAGLASVGDSVAAPASDFQASTILTFEILDVLRRHRPQCKFVLLSSAAVYGNPHSSPISEDAIPAPISPYGFHKLQCELLCKEFSQVYGLSTVSLRIFSAYAPGLRRQVIWDICRKALTQSTIRLQGTGQESRDFIHAQDISDAIGIITKSASFHGEVYNLATGREVNISELVEIILLTLGKKKKVYFDGIVPAGVPLNWRADISKVRALGFSPLIVLEQGVGDFVDWVKEEAH